MLVHLACLAVCLAAVRGRECYGEYTMAAEEHSLRHYWYCEGYGKEVVLKTCDDSEIYDRKTGLCVVALKLRDGRLVKRAGTNDEGKNIEVIEREALGETLSLGTLYDARKSLMANGVSFWNNATLDAEHSEVNTTYSSVEVYMENSIEERSYKMGIDASLKMEFLGGLISVAGSAHYLRDEKSSTDVARVTMNYYATTKTHILPVHTPKNMGELCTTIDANTGPTHVVSSITFGIRSFMLFEKEVNKLEYKEEVGGSLSIAVKSIPSFSVEASATVDVDGNEVTHKESMRIKFYGDVILDELPSTYNQTIFAFQSVNDAANTTMNPIKYQLTPIGMYCDATEAMINAINEGQTQKVTSVLTELGDVKRRLSTLLGKDPAIRFSSIRSQLLTFQNGLDSYTTSITADIATALPAVKAGDMTEQALWDLYGDYVQSKWNKGSANVFLDHRAREIRTIELVTEGAKDLPEVTLSDIGAATDNKCIFNFKYSTVYQLYVLPTQNVAEMYIKGEYTDDTERNQWYNDLYRVGQAGANLKNFLTHATLNAHDDHCFLIRLDTIASNQIQGKDALTRLYKNGKVVESDFKPPMAPPVPSCTKNLYNGFRLSGVMNTDATSHVTAVKVTATWKREKEKKEDDTSGVTKYDYFPTEFTVLNKDVESFTISKLIPNKEYEIKMAYRVGQDLGFSGESEIAFCKTGATSAPILPQVTGHTSKSVSLKWNAPQKSAVPMNEVSYIITASINREITRKLETSALSITVDQLEQGTYYDFAIQPVYKGVGSQSARLSFATVPYAPDVPLLESVTDSNMQLIVYIDRMDLPTGIRKDAVMLRFYKMNSKGSESLYGTDRVITAAVSNPDQAQVITINGLDAGAKYGVRAKLRVEVTGRLYETPESEGLIVTTAVPDGDFSTIEQNVNTYITETNKDIAALGSTTSTVGGAVDALVSRMSTEFGNFDRKVQETQNKADTNLGAYDLFVAGLTRDSCVKRGIRADSSNGKLGTFSGVTSEFDCLSKCTRYSTTASASYQGGSSRTCTCFSSPITAVAFDRIHDATSIDTKCFGVAGALAAKWKSCVRVNTDYNGGDIHHMQGVASIRDCAILCSGTLNCRSVGYSRLYSTCYLKHKDTGDRVHTGISGFDSVTLSCLD